MCRCVCVCVVGLTDTKQCVSADKSNASESAVRSPKHVLRHLELEADVLGKVPGFNCGAPAFGSSVVWTLDRAHII